jgi:hypothetical protein
MLYLAVGRLARRQAERRLRALMRDHPEHAPELDAAMRELRARRALRSWYLVAQADQALSPDAQRMFANRMGATIAEVASGHLAMVCHPADVVKLIEAAADAGLAVDAVD